MQNAEEKTKKPDRRPLRTKRRIREAFVELSSRKGTDNVTISELAKLADIDRKTFYLHYESTDQVLDELQSEILEKLMVIIKRHDLFSPGFDALAFFRDINRFINEDYELYRKLLLSGRYDFFLTKMKNKLRGIIMERYRHRSGISENKLMLYAEFATSGLMSMYVEFFNNPEIRLEDIAEVATNVIYGHNKIIIATNSDGNAGDIQTP